METTIVYWGVYRDNGKNGNYYSRLGLCRIKLCKKSADYARFGGDVQGVGGELSLLQSHP